MSRIVPEPKIPSILPSLGDPISQAEKFLVAIFEDLDTWQAIDAAGVSTKEMFGPRAIYYGGWFPTCASRSHVCVNDLSKRKRGAVCVYDCTNLEPKTGRFSASEVEKWIKVPPYRTTDKSYHPNITNVIQEATDLEAAYLERAEAANQATFNYQAKQGAKSMKIDLSTDDNIIH